MIMQKMSKPQCLLYSAAMVLGEDPETLIKEIGHDGLTVRWPGKVAPHCYQGFHPQEIIDCCLRRGRYLVVIESEYYSAPEGGIPYKIPAHKDRIHDYMSSYPGIVVLPGHAVAWNGWMYYDPNGVIRDKIILPIQEFWLVTP